MFKVVLQSQGSPLLIKVASCIVSKNQTFSSKSGFFSLKLKKDKKLNKHKK